MTVRFNIPENRFVRILCLGVAVPLFVAIHIKSLEIKPSITAVFVWTTYAILLPFIMVASLSVGTILAIAGLILKLFKKN